MKNVLKRNLIYFKHTALFFLIWVIGLVGYCSAGQIITIGIVEATGEARCKHARDLELCKNIRKQSFETNLLLMRQSISEQQRQTEENSHIYFFGASSKFIEKDLKLNRNHLITSLKECRSNPNPKYVFSEFAENQLYSQMMRPIKVDPNFHWRSSAGFIRVTQEGREIALHPLFIDILPYLLKCANSNIINNRKLPTENKIDLSGVDGIEVFVLADKHDSEYEKRAFNKYSPPSSGMDQFFQTGFKLISEDEDNDPTLGVRFIKAELWQTSFNRIIQLPKKVNLHRDSLVFKGEIFSGLKEISSKLTAVPLGEIGPKNSNSFLNCTAVQGNSFSCELKSTVIPDGLYSYGIMNGKKLLATTELHISGMNRKILDLHQESNQVDLSNFAEVHSGNLLYLCEGTQEITTCGIDGLKQCTIPWDVLRTLNIGADLYSLKISSCNKNSVSLIDFGLFDHTTSNIMVDSFFHNSSLEQIIDYPIVQASHSVYGCAMDGSKVMLYSKEKNGLTIGTFNKLMNGYNNFYEIKSNSCQSSVSLGTVKLTTPQVPSNLEFLSLIILVSVLLAALYFISAILSRKHISNQDPIVNKIN